MRLRERSFLIACLINDQYSAVISHYKGSPLKICDNLVNVYKRELTNVQGDENIREQIQTKIYRFLNRIK